MCQCLPVSRFNFFNISIILKLPAFSNIIKSPPFQGNVLSLLILVFTEKYCTANHVDKLPGPRDWVQILQDQIKLARRRLKRGSGKQGRKKYNSVWATLVWC